MEVTVATLQIRFPGLTYTPGPTFCWSPKKREISYATNANSPTAVWSLLHETSHALLEHTSYHSDVELLRLELAAWEHAKGLAAEFGLQIDEEHVQDCLDSYRDWIYARSICPRCSNKSLQQDDLVHYRCFNCHNTWRVTPSRFCRAYRATKHVPQGQAAVANL